jgi:hypothetical protein
MLRRDLPFTDLFEIETNSRQCACGRKFLPLRFIPHVATAIHRPDGSIFYDLSLADQLKSQYFNFQLIQQDQTIFVLYVSRDRRADGDLEFIRGYLSEQGFKNVVFVKDCCLVSGGSHKLPAFYNNHLRKPFRKWLPITKLFV